MEHSRRKLGHWEHKLEVQPLSLSHLDMR
jgi:hypothetical protein